MIAKRVLKYFTGNLLNYNRFWINEDALDAMSGDRRKEKLKVILTPGFCNHLIFSPISLVTEIPCKKQKKTKAHRSKENKRRSQVYSKSSINICRISDGRKESQTEKQNVGSDY